ncbi:LysR family transcriptional regulator [Ferrovibrio sp.]|uniref:LysR family transcriptional regulator n=1 Tax=Ferrovibrio sp. TaxID=1917215 RepID=UPI000CB8D3ED|nr:MAG: hypothetical protein CTR53_07330 [Ferrovibrio sp.]
MNITQLETLVWLSRLRSFRKVAQQLGTSQPAISMRIRQLERELGVTLFRRSPTRTQLTENGRQLLEYAVAITDLASQLVQKAAKTSGHMTHP